MLIHHSEQGEESLTYLLPRRERNKVRVIKMKILGKFGKNLDRAGERCGTLGFWKSRTVSSVLLANEDEILGKNLRNLIL
jgi:hypothetical protein